MNSRDAPFAVSENKQNSCSHLLDLRPWECLVSTVKDKAVSLAKHLFSEHAGVSSNLAIVLSSSAGEDKKAMGKKQLETQE